MLHLKISPFPFAVLLWILGVAIGVSSELENTGPVTFMAHNSSHPDINGKFLFTYQNSTYLDAGAANPRLSFLLVAKLYNTSLIRIPERGSPPDNIANLNFGTSNVCCNYAALNWNTKQTLPLYTRTKPFFIDKAGDLQFEELEFRTNKWHACTVGSRKKVYWGFPVYDFPNPPIGAEKACTVVQIATVRPLATPGPKTG